MKSIGPGTRDIPQNGGTIFLHAGETLEVIGPVTGPVKILAQGTPDAPIIIRPPQGTRAELRTETDGLILVNPEHVEVHDLDIYGTDRGDGLLVWAESQGHGNVSLRGISVTGASNGIAVGSAVAGGLDRVLVSECRVSTCLLQGILIWGPESPEFGLSNIRIENCRVDGTRGEPTVAHHHTGSGIVIGSVVDGEVLSCWAEGNGAGCRASEGPEGIFLYDCRRVAIRNCDAVSNRTGGPADGGGFGIDIRCEDCIIEDSRAEDNDGAGVLLWNLPGYIAGHHIVRRNTLSNNCRRTTWHGEITVAPSIGGAQIIANRLAPRVGSAAIRVGIGTPNLTITGNQVPRGTTFKVEEIEVYAHPGSGQVGNQYGDTRGSSS